jgi:hypothetical protein
MPAYVNEWQNKVSQDSCTLTLFCHSFTYTGIHSLYYFVSTTVLPYFIFPFIYIYRHPFSVLFCQYNCLALLYFAIHLHIPASCLLTVLSVQLSCFTLFCHSFTYTGILSLYRFVSTTVLPYFILPFIYIYRHPFSVLFCQYNCLALLYFAIHLHIPTSIFCTVLSVQLSCLTLFCHSFTYIIIHSLYCFVITTVLPYFGKTVVLTKQYREWMPVYVNEWQNKVRQDSCTDKTVQRMDAGICK